MVETIPLTMDALDSYRVGSSRVTLDVVIRALNRGATAEEIAQDDPSLDLAVVCQVTGYYLKRGSDLVEYFERRARKEQGHLEDREREW